MKKEAGPSQARPLSFRAL